ncbi:uncharacterized protein JCM10292_002538 [Rhodotorula paludigena]|uniref:uncharacterized protein n=1 Tax=Rhodotorula paludigena TaxID=86838 RepID=UPI00317FB902
MPQLQGKRARVNAAGAPASLLHPSARWSSPAALISLPKDILARIAALVSLEGDGEGKPKSTLLSLASTCKTLRAVCLPLVLSTIRLMDGDALVKALKVLKGQTKAKSSVQSSEGGIARFVREIHLSLPALFGTMPSHSTLLSSTASLLSLIAPTLTSLCITLGPSSALQPFSSLFPPSSPSLAALSGLSHLASFTLRGAFLWLHDLAPLLSSWPALISLSLDSLRGDCTRPPHPCAPRGRTLRHLSIRASSLTAEHIARLLDGQLDLVHIEMPLLGGEGRAWDVLRTVMSEGGRVEVLRIWDRSGGAGTTTAAAGGEKRKGKATSQSRPRIVAGKDDEVDQLDSQPLHAEAEADEGQAEVVVPRSPLLPLLLSFETSTSTLSHLFLPLSLLPSPRAASFTALAPAFPSSLSTLEFDDLSAASGLRDALVEALERGELCGLERVVAPVGRKGRAGTTKGRSKADAAFEKTLSEYGVHWDAAV